MEKQVYLSSTPEETRNIAKLFANTLSGGEVIAMEGDLGAGKTCFVSGLAEGLEFQGEVYSPTFAIINEYVGGRLNLYHFDMYRVEGWEDLYTTGYFEYLESGGLLAVEWSENIAAALPQKYISVRIEKQTENERKITIEEKQNEDFIG